jgi:hypothetical protein
VPIAELLPAEPWAQPVLNLLEIERRGAKAYLPGTTAALGERTQAASDLEEQLAKEEIAKVDDRELAAFLEDSGRVRRVGDGFAVSPALYDRGRELLARLDDYAGRVPRCVGRAPNGATVVERYDADGLTLRRGDVRVLRRARGSTR